MHLRFQSNTIFVLIIENFGLPIWIFVLFFFLSWKAAVAAEIRQLTPTPFYELDKLYYLVSVVKITPTSFFQQ